MVRFIRHILGIILSASVVLLAIDLLFTKAFSSAPPSDKIALLKQYSEKKVNYIFVGSSRVNNDIIPAVIYNRTGKTALNLGISSGRPRDILTIVRLIRSHNIACDSIFVQADYSFNHLESSKTLEYNAMPYVWGDAVLRDHIGYLPDAFAIRFIPFYRYAAYDQKLGIRSLLEIRKQKYPTSLQQTWGYMARHGQTLMPRYSLPDTIIDRNIYLEELDKFASAENLKIVYFTSPFMKSIENIGFMDKLKTKIPKLHDFSQAVTNDSLFSNQSHLNHEGAKIFTNLIVDSLLAKSKKAP